MAVTNNLTFYTPGVGGQPFGNQNANPQASNYQATSGYGVTSTILIDKAVAPLLFNNTARAFDVMTILFSKPYKTYNSDEFEYLEYTTTRSPVELAANVAAAGPVVGAATSATLTLTPQSMRNIGLNSVLTFQTNEQVIIRSINTAANQVTVETHTSGSIPTVTIATQNPMLSVSFSVSADGRDNLTNYQRQDTITRYN